ncbi:hypothetical protein HZS_3269 [Henneguya salminicola]|nr:hypothetical protein HZS_3269 [Henneguya salminicola]
MKGTKIQILHARAQNAGWCLPLDKFLNFKQLIDVNFKLTTQTRNRFGWELNFIVLPRMLGQ